MLTTWKLSIKPHSEKGFNAFEFCRNNHLIGVGWHHNYINQNPTNIDEAKKLVIQKWKKWPSALKYLLEKVKKDDHVWIHQKGKYHLCKIQNDELLYGQDINENFDKYDLGHARIAEWVEVPEVFVSGKVQRGTIAQRMIQKIKITDDEVKYNEFLFEKLSNDENWFPNIDEMKLKILMQEISKKSFFDLMTPDDVEDLVSAYLQSQNWLLIKSTCFRSKPKYEFSMQNKSGKVARIQVKSGKNPNSLPPKNYKDDANENSLVFLFSTNKEPYPGDSVEYVHALSDEELFSWQKNNLWTFAMSLKIRFWIYLNILNNPNNNLLD